MSLYTVKYSPQAKAEGSNVSSTTVSADSVTFSADGAYVMFSLAGQTTKIIRVDLVDEVDLGT